MQPTIESYEKISKIEEEKSIEKIGWIILLIADHLSEKHNGRIIPHSELVDEARENCKLETIQIHEALRYLIEKLIQLLYEVENAPVVCYTRQELKRAVVYETNNSSSGAVSSWSKQPYNNINTNANKLLPGRRPVIKSAKSRKITTAEKINDDRRDTSQFRSEVLGSK